MNQSRPQESSNEPETSNRKKWIKPGFRKMSAGSAELNVGASEDGLDAS